jgi:exopolysaccharide biosynthesis polyprenyl glycosylphosphotransferase
MGKRKEIGVLLLADFISICLAWVIYYYVRVRSGWIDMSVEPELAVPMLFVYGYWVVVFWLVGLYRSWYASSRFDELALLFKTVTFGCLFLFFAVFVDDQGSSVSVSSRLLILLYWAIVLATTSLGRMGVRSIQRNMLIAGIGVHRTLIAGGAERARELYARVQEYPALGYRVVGFAGLDRRWTDSGAPEAPVLGSVDDLHTLIPRHEVREVLIALDSSDHDRLLDVIAQCNGHKVSLKIVPDLYDIISGQARTNAIYGFPLIEISPQLLSPWEAAVKRTMDVGVAGITLVLGIPLWLLIGLAIRLESPGPALYRQRRVGKDGTEFQIFKFRSMRQDAERGGAQWARKRDPRVTRVGRFLRNTHLDEIPQVINVLKGEMSLVGPRPERPEFVEKLAVDIPLYLRRLKVRPGVTGWAQVKHKYDESIEDVRKKVEYDLYYIENMSLRMDMKIILSTVYHTVLGKGH